MLFTKTVAVFIVRITREYTDTLCGQIAEASGTYSSQGYGFCAVHALETMS
jgi:hypothetical protein